MISSGGLKYLFYFNFPPESPKPSKYDGKLIYLTLMIDAISWATPWLGGAHIW
jgi:hypothetical protein